MLTKKQLLLLEPERKYFIETNRNNATYWQWLFSKGTNYSCYIEYLNGLDDEIRFNKTIDTIRIISYALSRYISFPFFYFTMVIFILHKFNFKKPVLKILLIHIVLRSTGNVLDKFGELKSHYFSNKIILDDNDNETIVCNYYSLQPYQHPLRWFVTRYFGTILWYVGEMAVDWYPLLRTKAVVKDERSIKYVYLACGIFNFTKILLILYHFTLSPKEIYNENGVYDDNRIKKFYYYYWMIQLSIIYSSFIYELTVFMVLKKNIFNKLKTENGFLKKFRSISEYRIFFTAAISVTLLPAISVSVILHCMFYAKNIYQNIDTTFEDIRKIIANVEYYMIYIDQILLLYAKEKTSLDNPSSPNTNSSGINPNSTLLLKPIKSKVYFNNLYKLNNNDDTLTNSP